MSTITDDSAAGPPGVAARSAELAVGGMTCASCAARVEKKLNRLDGVTATVNFATGTARVRFPAAVSPGDLISVVEQAGYTAALPATPQDEPPGAAGEADGAGEADSLRQRLLVSLAGATYLEVASGVTALVLVGLGQCGGVVDRYIYP